MSTESTSLSFIPPKRIRKRISNLVFGSKYAIDLTPGDHVYVYSGSNLYTHHGQCGRGWEGLDPTFKVQPKDSCKVEDSYLTSYAAIMGGIVDGDGYIIHNVEVRDSYRYNMHGWKRSKTCLKKCKRENCPTFYGDRKCGIVKTCIECFKGERELHKYRYGIKNYNPWRPADGGTTTELEKSSDPEEILERARDSLENNNFGKFELQHNNCEDFAVYCSTGHKGKSKQSKRLGWFMPYVKLVPPVRRQITNKSNHSKL